MEHRDNEDSKYYLTKDTMDPYDPNPFFGKGTEPGDDEQLHYLNWLAGKVSDPELGSDDEHSNEVYYKPHTGKFTRPHRNTWESNNRAVKKCHLGFSPTNYPFDAAMAEHYNNPNFSDPTNPNYPLYEPLRNNIAVLRNYLLNHFFPDGSFDLGEDDKMLPYVNQVAASLGDMLHQGGSFISNPLAVSVNPNKANIDGVGAAMLYEGLEKCQDRNNFPVFAQAKGIYNFFKGNPDNRWKLPPIQETPFGPLGLSAVPPADCRAAAAAAMAGLPLLGEAPTITPNDIVTPKDLAVQGEILASHAYQPLGDVNQLEQPVKREAIDIAHEILKKMKVMFHDTPVQKLMDFDSGLMNSLMLDMCDVAGTYQQTLREAFANNPMILTDQNVLEANTALGKLSYLSTLQARNLAAESGDANAVAQLDGSLQAMPKAWEVTQNSTLAEILDKLEHGLSAAEQNIARQVDVNNAGGILPTSSQLETDPQLANSLRAKEQEAKTRQQQQQGMLLQQEAMLAARKQNSGLGGVNMGVQPVAAQRANPRPRSSNVENYVRQRQAQNQMQMNPQRQMQQQRPVQPAPTVSVGAPPPRPNPTPAVGINQMDVLLNEKARKEMKERMAAFNPNSPAVMPNSAAKTVANLSAKKPSARNGQVVPPKPQLSPEKPKDRDLLGR